MFVEGSEGIRSSQRVAIIFYNRAWTFLRHAWEPLKWNSTADVLISIVFLDLAVNANGAFCVGRLPGSLLQLRRFFHKIVNV